MSAESIFSTGIVGQENIRQYIRRYLISLSAIKEKRNGAALTDFREVFLKKVVFDCRGSFMETRDRATVVCGLVCAVIVRSRWCERAIVDEDVITNGHRRIFDEEAATIILAAPTGYCEAIQAC